jgi:hypothetical protein
MVSQSRFSKLGAWIAPLTCALLISCGTHTEQTAERSVSPLIATWTRDGSTPSGSGSGAPQFTKLTFSPDGSLQASYVAGGVGAAIGASPSVKAENDTYRTPGGSKLSIAEGTRHLGYAYRVDGSKLYLTPEGASEAQVFTKAG